jgi:hypothetical protein
MENRTMFLVVIVLILMGCSSNPKPTMVYNQSSQYADYRELLEEKRNILLSFEGYPGYEALVWSDDIEIFDYNFLGFIPVYRNLNVFILNGEKVLLKDISQGIKTLHVILIPKADNRPKTQSRYILSKKLKNLRGEIRLNIGIEEDTISIIDPESVVIQQIVHIERVVSLKKKQQDKKEKEDTHDKNTKVNTPEEYLRRLENK